MKRYFWNVLIWFDQGVNTLAGPWLNYFVKGDGAKFGDPDETLSSVFGKNMKGKTCPVCTWICKYILHPIDRGHCEKSIEADEGGR